MKFAMWSHQPASQTAPSLCSSFGLLALTVGAIGLARSLVAPTSSFEEFVARFGWPGHDSGQWFSLFTLGHRKGVGGESVFYSPGSLPPAHVRFELPVPRDRRFLRVVLLSFVLSGATSRDAVGGSQTAATMPDSQRGLTGLGPALASQDREATGSGRRFPDRQSGLGTPDQ